MWAFAALIPLAFSAASALARPLGSRDGVTTWPTPFSVAAYYTSQPNANSTGVPLVLGQAGAVDGESFRVFSTWASYPYNDHPTLTLTSGGLTAAASGESTFVGGVFNQNGDEPVFVTTIPEPSPAEIYYISSDNLLGVYGHTDLFSLCIQDGYPTSQNNVYYGSTPSGFICEPVVLNVVS